MLAYRYIMRFPRPRFGTWIETRIFCL